MSIVVIIATINYGTRKSVWYDCDMEVLKKLYYASPYNSTLLAFLCLHFHKLCTVAFLDLTETVPDLKHYS